MTKTVEEKTRLIAEKVMGWEFVWRNMPEREYKWKYRRNKSGIFGLWSFDNCSFTPYTSTNDFLEVLRALDDNILFEIQDRIPYFNSTEYLEKPDLKVLVWLCDNKPAVLDCLVDILEGE